MKKVVHFEVHFVILYSKTELLNLRWIAFFYEAQLLFIWLAPKFRVQPNKISDSIIDSLLIIFCR